MTVPVQLRGERRSAKVLAMIDSGASSIFIHRRFIERHRVRTDKLVRPIPLVNADDSANKIGAITEQARLRLIMAEHEEDITASVAEIGPYDLIIGVNWLRHHNPEIDWTVGRVEMSRCPPGCADTGAQVFEPVQEEPAKPERSLGAMRMTVAEIEEEEEEIRGCG